MGSLEVIVGDDGAVRWESLVDRADGYPLESLDISGEPLSLGHDPAGRLNATDGHHLVFGPRNRLVAVLDDNGTLRAGRHTTALAVWSPGTMKQASSRPSPTTGCR